MQRIAVRAECADGKSVVRELLLELLQRDPVVEHGQFAMRIAGIISGAELDCRNIQRAQLLEHFFKGKLRQEGSEDADSHRVKNINVRGIVGQPMLAAARLSAGAIRLAQSQSRLKPGCGQD
jgi:hypothetical protein